MTKIYKYLFFFVVLFYAIFLSQFGFENWDTGYFTSFSWRILNGQIPYSDFIYKFPPVSIYWHAFWLKILPENGQYYFTRFVNYILFGLQVFFTVSAFDRLFYFQSIKVDKWAIMCLGFTLSLLNFPAFAWNTIDGLLFASAAFYLMTFTKTTAIRLAFIALCCILSALTKQSFYAVPFLFLIWIFLQNGLKYSLVFVAFTTLYLSSFLFFINYVAGFERYFDLITGETNLHGFIYVGIIEYFLFFYNPWITVAIIIISVTALLISKVQHRTFLHHYFRSLSFTIILFSIALILINEIRTASKVAFVALACIICTKFIFEKVSLRKLAPIIVSLGIAWCASISFGYSYPIFYFTGIISGIIALVYADISMTVPRPYIYIISIMLFSIGFANNYRPYREQSLPELIYSMDKISPKLTYVKTSKENFEKHLELKELVGKYGPNYIVAPSIPAAHYLFSTQSSLPADWIINTEVNRQYDLFVTLASNKKNYVFLEKSYLTGEELSLDDRRETSEISWQIYKTFRKIDETDYFIIYNGLQ